MLEELTSIRPGLTRGKNKTTISTREGLPSNYHSFACGNTVSALLLFWNPGKQALLHQSFHFAGLQEQYQSAS
jgi:hypothetical protein